MKNLFWVCLIGIVSLLIGGCADVEYEEDAVTANQPLLRFTPIVSDGYAEQIVSWGLVGISRSTPYVPFTTAITDDNDATYIYSRDMTDAQPVEPYFKIDQSPLPDLCRFKNVYWDAWIRLRNGNNLSTAKLTVNVYINYAKKKSTYSGTPRHAYGKETLSFQQMVNLGVNTDTFTHIELREITNWTVRDIESDVVTNTQTNTSLGNVEVWRKLNSTTASIHVQAVNYNNQVQISKLRPRFRCDAP